MQSITKLSKGIIVFGNIKSTEDVNALKEVIGGFKLKSGDVFHIELADSFAMPSAMIGYLIMLVEQNKLNLSLTVRNAGLAELLDDLGLTQTLQIKTLSYA